MNHTTYLAAGANRQTAAADWADDGTLVYGAGVNLAVWRPADEAGLGHLLRGHADTVKAVQCVGGSDVDDKETLFVTGGDDKSLKLWAISRTGSGGRCLQTVADAHGGPVNCIAAVRTRAETEKKTGRRRQLLATGGADYTIKIWALDAGEPRLALLQTIATTTPRYFPLCLALVALGSDNDNSLLLAAAGTSNRIQLFVGEADSATDKSTEFTLAATLAGHDGWVRSLDFTWETRGTGSAMTQSDLLLASASQDKYVRLWRVHAGGEAAAGDHGLEPEHSQTAAGMQPAAAAAAAPTNKAYRLRTPATDYAVTFEALLLGHEDWIYSAKWDSPSNVSSARLLTASADNSLAVWEADAASGIWLTTARLGELSKEKGATTATGSVGGFWLGLWGPASARDVVVLCRTGSWRRWVQQHADSADSASAARWRQAVGVSGHVKPVTGVAWSRDGAYLLSTSSDQTTRLHGAWRSRSRARLEVNPPSWHEMARPQIHGYDLNCIDTLGSAQFVAGADEKLKRVFHEPKSVARLLADLGVGGPSRDLEALPDAANMPVLGLSNKAVEDEAEAADEAQPQETAEQTRAVHPPHEDTLARSTLWPETEKLYGHGYEISCLAVSHDASLVASACRATSLNHAVVRLFETATWTEVRPPLAAHSLTVTRLRFSDDDALLLSVGRDRQWAVFRRSTTGSSTNNEYTALTTNPKAHTRMLLDCAWAPTTTTTTTTTATSTRVFATAGRDKNVKVWMGDADTTASFSLATTIPQDHPVTAVDFLWRTSASNNGSSSFVLAIGTEAGQLSVVSLDAATLAVQSVLALDDSLCLPRAVLQLAWRPRHVFETETAEKEADTAKTADLAIAGEDASLRIYNVNV